MPLLGGRIGVLSTHTIRAPSKGHLVSESLSHDPACHFDDPNLVSAAGWSGVRLAESAGLHDLLEQQVSVASPNAAAKATSVVGGMLAGADSIDDLDLLAARRDAAVVLRGAGALDVGHVPALVAWARAATRCHRRRFLAGPTRRVPGCPRRRRRRRVACIDVDDTIREVHGYAKQAAAYGYTGVRGLNIQLATVSTPLAAPVIARARLRKRSTASAKGAGRLLAQAITHGPHRGREGSDPVPGRLGLLRVGVRRNRDPAKAWFSVTARMTRP